MGVICGFGCSSPEPGQPEPIGEALEQMPADVAEPSSDDEQPSASRLRRPQLVLPAVVAPELYAPGGVAPGVVSQRPLGESPVATGPVAESPVPAGPVAATRAERVAALVSPLLEKEWLKGVSIALVEGDEVETFGYGAVRDGGPAPDETTLFEIGSITKTFTGLLLADLVREGRVELEQPVESLLPAGVSVPEFDGRSITLLDLVTHTSGLPPMPTNFFPEVEANPYADYDVEDLYEFLSSHTLAVAPGERYEYSNVGVGLLGHALSFAAGVSYEDAIRSRILEPLSMRDTTLQPSSGQAQRLASGYDLDSADIPGWDFTPALEGAGALRSSAADMGRYIAAQLSETVAGDFSASLDPLLASIALARAPRRRTDAGDGLGLGWFVSGADIVQHSGETGGFHSFALADRAQGVGVVVLANTASSLVDALGMQLYELLGGGTPAPMDLPSFVQLDVAELEACIGTYRFGAEIGADIDVVREGDRLYAELPGLRTRLHPLSPTSFYSKGTGAVVRFEPEGAAQYLRLVFEYSAEESYSATRV